MMNTDLTGVILAGGRARRMQGDPALRAMNPDACRAGAQDPGGGGPRTDIEKGLLDWRGRPLVAHAAAYLEQRVRQVLISANRAADRYAVYGRVVSDEQALGRDAGPLAGVASALAVSATPWLLVIPVDVPNLPGDLDARLLQAAAEQGSPVAYAMTSRPHPLCMVAHRGVLPDLRSFLAAGGRRVRDWQARHRPACVAFASDEGWFENLNTPDDWRRAARSR